MALDEALLDHTAGGEDELWLRFYQWQEPTLSLGYFQPYAPWREHVTRQCAVVRRQTGGGAILHDRELTYSLVLPIGHPATGGAAELYALVHNALIEAIGRLGVCAQLHGPNDANAGGEPDEFYCLHRRSPVDVVVQGEPIGKPQPITKSEGVVGPRHRNYKVCGSAQRRRRGAVLMHGSVLCASSPLAPQILGMKEVTGCDVELEALALDWSEELAGALGIVRWTGGCVPDTVRLAAQKLADGKYSAQRWTRKR
jgi:lipoate-protein ligase A